jgi:hypothetical protein
MSVRILDSAADAETWTDLLGRVPGGGDVYFHPQYVEMNTTHAAQGRLFAYEHDGDLWLYPFLLRPLEDDDACDIESPYGYSGPLSSSGHAGFLQAAHAAFREWSGDAGVIAEFVRLHPLIGNERWLDPAVEIQTDRVTVSLVLDGQEADFGLDKKTLYMIRRAERDGLSAQPFGPGAGFSHFAELYFRTMSRLDAGEEYRFSEDYFGRLADLVAKTGCALAATASAGWAAAAVFLQGSELMHYHLSAADRDLNIPGATNLLILTAARRGREAGLRRLHLGGGRTRAAGDTLLRFKETMASHSHPFLIGRRIHDAKRYALLREGWSRRHPDLVAAYGQRLLCYRYTS